jgi:hypothetical protein
VLVDHLARTPIDDEPQRLMVSDRGDDELAAGFVLDPDPVVALIGEAPIDLAG